MSYACTQVWFSRTTALYSPLKGSNQGESSQNAGGTQRPNSVMIVNYSNSFLSPPPQKKDGCATQTQKPVGLPPLAPKHPASVGGGGRFTGTGDFSSGVLGGAETARSAGGLAPGLSRRLTYLLAERQSWLRRHGKGQTGNFGRGIKVSGFVS